MRFVDIFIVQSKHNNEIGGKEMERNEFRGISRPQKSKPDYSYLFMNSGDYGAWNCKKETQKKRKGDRRHE